MIRLILTDIEGTTSAASFVHQVLFPYSLARMRQYIEQHAAEDRVAQAITAVKQVLHQERGMAAPTQDDCIAALEGWIREDRKQTELKKLQGWIWDEGYEAGDFTSHLYPDVLPALQAWHVQGYALGVYSSGSVYAQRQFFANTGQGDITPLFSCHFDTEVGGKREAASYTSIARQLGLPPADILFLSDVPAELDAAVQAGVQVVHIVRPGTEVCPRYTPVGSFADVVLAG